MKATKPLMSNIDIYTTYYNYSTEETGFAHLAAVKARHFSSACKIHLKAMRQPYKAIMGSNDYAGTFPMYQSEDDVINALQTKRG